MKTIALSVAFAYILLLSGCALLDSAHLARSNDATNNEPSCEPIANFDQLNGRKLIVFGELHGTREAPAFVGHIACHFVKTKKVIVALEQPEEALFTIAQAVESDREPDIQAMKSVEAWASGIPDGRSSLAIWDLVVRISEFSRRTGRLSVAVFDKRSSEPLAGALRERRMAENLAAIVSRADANTVVLALTGNLHSRVERGAPWDPNFESMTYQLKSLNPLSLALSHKGGTAWVCAPECGVRAMRANEREFEKKKVGVYLDPGTQKHDGVFFVGGISASPPMFAR